MPAAHRWQPFSKRKLHRALLEKLEVAPARWFVAGTLNARVGTMLYRTFAPAALAILFTAGAAVFEANDNNGFPTTYFANVGGALVWGAVGLAVGLLVNVAVECRFRFTIRGVILATVWVAVCCVAWRFYGYLLRHQDRRYPIFLYIDPILLYLAANLLRYFPIPAAIGSLFGRPWYGVAIGVGLFLVWFLISVFLLYGGYVFI